MLSTKVDTFKCLASYQEVISKIGKLLVRRESGGSIAIFDDISDVNNAITEFKTQCDKTQSDTACDGVLTVIGTAPTQANTADFATKCTVTAATANGDGCYNAYDALIKAVEALKPSTRKSQLKVSPADEFKTFTEKCLKTVQGTTCYNVIKDFTAAGPAYANLDSLKASCKVDPPPPEPEADGGKNIFSSNLNLLFLMSSILTFCFMI
jgi:Tfp pilus assembly major pilin PilA